MLKHDKKRDLEKQDLKIPAKRFSKDVKNMTKKKDLPKTRSHDSHKMNPHP